MQAQAKTTPFIDKTLGGQTRLYSVDLLRGLVMIYGPLVFFSSFAGSWRKADAPQQVGKARVWAQAIQHRVNLKIE